MRVILKLNNAPCSCSMFISSKERAFKELITIIYVFSISKNNLNVCKYAVSIGQQRKTSNKYIIIPILHIG